MRYVWVVFYLVSVSVNAKTEKNDLEVVDAILSGVHPSGGFSQGYSSDTRSLVSDIQAYFIQRKQLSQLQDAHSYLQPSGKLQKKLLKSNVFPYYVKIVSNKIYINDGRSDIYHGSEVLSINGKKSDLIIKRLLPFTFMDGRKSIKRSGALESEFNFLLIALLGNPEEFIVRYKNNTKAIKKIVVKAVSLESLYNREDPPISYFIDNEICRGETCNATINKDSDAILYSRITDFGPAFNFNMEQSISFVQDIIDSSQRDNARNIIFDLRNNPGGLREISIAIAAPFIRGEFSQRDVSFIRKSEDFYSEYMNNPENKKEIKDLLNDFKECESGFCRYGDHLSKLSDDGVAVNRDIWILVNNSTSSAAVEFAGALRQFHPLTRIVGTEAAGSYSYHTGDYAVEYRLPASGNIMTINLMGVQRSTASQPDINHTGLIPDIWCTEDADSLRQGNDQMLECVLQSISNKQ